MAVTILMIWDTVVAIIDKDGMNYMSAQTNAPLPRERLHDLVCDAGLTRPIIQPR